MKVILPCIIYRPIVGFVYSVSISGKIDMFIAEIGYLGLFGLQMGLI